VVKADRGSGADLLPQLHQQLTQQPTQQLVPAQHMHVVRADLAEPRRQYTVNHESGVPHNREATLSTQGRTVQQDNAAALASTSCLSPVLYTPINTVAWNLLQQLEQTRAMVVDTCD